MRTSTHDSGSDDDTAAYRLPTTVLPHHYRLTLAPDLNAATFTGDVEIDLSVEGSTSTIVLNAAELEIASATLRAGDAASASRPRSPSTPTRSAPSSSSTGPWLWGRPLST